MPTYNDYGIVLNDYDFADADKILNIYTKENGLVRAICKGIRKLGSKLSGKVNQISCCCFQFAKGKNLDVVCDCEQINTFSLLRSDLTRLTYAILFAEVVSKFAHEKETESSHIYDLLYSSLDELQRTSDPELFSIKFITQFLSIHGYKPQLETCVSCSLEVLKSENIYLYSSILGGLLCSECASVIDHKPVDVDVLKIIREYGVQNTEREVRENVRKALALLKEHINHRAKSSIKTFDLVFSL